MTLPCVQRFESLDPSPLPPNSTDDPPFWSLHPRPCQYESNTKWPLRRRCKKEWRMPCYNGYSTLIWFNRLIHTPKTTWWVVVPFHSLYHDHSSKESSRFYVACCTCRDDHDPFSSRAIPPPNRWSTYNRLQPCIRPKNHLMVLRCPPNGNISLSSPL